MTDSAFSVDDEVARHIAGWQRDLSSVRRLAANTLEAITDVTQATVEETMARYGVTRLIHGHTHRPAIHSLHVDGRPAWRVVLGDWYEQGSVLRVDSDGYALAAL